MGDLQEPNAVLREEQSAPSNQCPSLIGPERWSIAEKETQKIISRVLPTDVSDQRRFQVIDYVRRLIKKCIGCEVFSYGSVPLRTYLPDGDIDLTGFGGASIVESLANEIVSELKREENSSTAEFVVKDIQLIHAEVKLVKCLVQNILVDISFNQLGGLSTLCFLEQVDQLIGKNHLFKRSIILIKAWCYYESRILGAYHGLISTYALETLVLYVFHVFNSTLDGPLAVLYRFLDYFSKFDWEKYCISLRGLVRLSSLPEIEAETPDNGGGDLLITDDFYRFCVETFSVPLKGADINSKSFPQKHLNIVDPLKEYNNLGRSVSQGNFYRIRSAFAYGARKLGQVLMRPEKNIAEELCLFFSNTLDRHGSGMRPDVQGPVLISCPSPIRPAGSIDDGVYVIDELEPETEFRTTSGKQRGSVLLEAEDSAKGSNAMGHHISGDEEDHAMPGIQGTKISNHSPKISSLRNVESDSHVAKPKPHFATHFFFSNSLSGNGKTKNRNMSVIQSEDQETRTSPGVLQAPDEEKSVRSGGPEFSNSSFGLDGDYNLHFHCLLCGRWCYEHALSKPTLPVPPPPLPPPPRSHYKKIISGGTIQRSSPRNVNGVLKNPVFYNRSPTLSPGGSFVLEETPRSQGLGTYFPNMQDRAPPGYRPSVVKGRNQQAPGSFLPRSNGQAFTLTEFPVNQGVGVRGPSDFHHSGSPRRRVHPNLNGSILRPVEVFEPGLVRHVPPQTPMLDSSRQPRPASSFPQVSRQEFPTAEMQSPKAVVGMGLDRVTCNVNGPIVWPTESVLVQLIPPQPPLLESSKQPKRAASLSQTSGQGVPTSETPSRKAAVGMDQDWSYQEDFPPLSI